MRAQHLGKQYIQRYYSTETSKIQHHRKKPPNDPATREAYRPGGGGESPAQSSFGRRSVTLPESSSCSLSSSLLTLSSAVLTVGLRSLTALTDCAITFYNAKLLVR